MTKAVINIDFDGTLTNGENPFTTDPTPNIKNIDIVRKIYFKGYQYIIIIHTARMWEFAGETVAWLIKHKVPFHGLYMAKGGSDYYIDDKYTTFDDLEKMIENDN